MDRNHNRGLKNMNIKNKIELQIDGFEKCHLSCEMDCSLSTIFDYSCILQNYVLMKMNEEAEKMKSLKETILEN